MLDVSANLVSLFQNLEVVYNGTTYTLPAGYPEDLGALVDPCITVDRIETPVLPGGIGPNVDLYDDRYAVNIHVARCDAYEPRPFLTAALAALHAKVKALPNGALGTAWNVRVASTPRIMRHADGALLEASVTVRAQAVE